MVADGFPDAIPPIGPHPVLLSFVQMAPKLSLPTMSKAPSEPIAIVTLWHSYEYSANAVILYTDLASNNERVGYARVDKYVSER